MPPALLDKPTTAVSPEALDQLFDSPADTPGEAIELFPRRSAHPDLSGYAGWDRWTHRHWIGLALTALAITTAFFGVLGALCQP